MTLDPLEDGRQEFLYRSTGEFVRMMEQCFGGHSLPWSTIERELQNAYDAGWTARAARERELRKIVADLRAHNIQGPSDVTGPVSEALNHIADRIEAALSETQPEERK